MLSVDPPLLQVESLVRRFGRAEVLRGISLVVRPGELHLVVHLARAGWLHYRESLSLAPLKPSGKGPIAPTWDYPNDFTTTETTVTVPVDWNVVGNGKLVSDSPNPGGATHTVHW